MQKLSPNQIKILLGMLTAPQADCSYKLLGSLTGLGGGSLEKEIPKYRKDATVNTGSLEALGMVRLTTVEESDKDVLYVLLTERGRQFARTIKSRKKAF